MSFDILATVIGHIADQAEAEQLAHDLKAVVARARSLGCAIDIRDLRLAREVQRVVIYPRVE
jgi:hypothetical protein